LSTVTHAYGIRVGIGKSAAYNGGLRLVSWFSERDPGQGVGRSTFKAVSFLELGRQKEVANLLLSFYLQINKIHSSKRIMLLILGK